jgi:hypothetical protein
MGSVSRKRYEESSEGQNEREIAARLSKKRGKRDYCKAGITRRVQATT